MHISARNKYIVKVSMVKYTQINAYLAKKSSETQTKAKIPRSSEKSPAVATLPLTESNNMHPQAQLMADEHHPI